MSGWTVAELRDIADIQLGKMLSPAAKRGVRPLPYLRNANVQWNGFDLTDVAEMDFTEIEEAKFLLREGDVLVVEGGEPGRAAVWDGSIERICYQKAVHRIRPHIDRLDPQFLVYRLWAGATRGEFTSGETKTTIAHLPLVRLERLDVPIPPLEEQRRIAARLRDQLALRDSLAGHLGANRRAVEALERRLVEQAAIVGRGTPTAAIGSLTDSPPSPSVKSDGDAPVTAVTSGCLTSAGWSDAGLKTARMRPADVPRGTLQPEEVLVSRSNTEELVGRAGVFPGSRSPIVATDLVFRLRAIPDRLMPDYLAIQLQVMQLGGYWFDRSSGASSTMKKITRTQLHAAVIPLPPIDEQRRIAARLGEQLAEIGLAKSALEAQRAAIDALPAALLREVFGSAVA